MRIVLVGAGAVGGFFGGFLARAGVDVAFVARGRTLAALRESGLRVESALASFTVRVAAAEEPAEIGPADAVLVAVKTWQVAEVAPRLAPLLGPETVVAPLENGVEAADQLASALGAGRVVGGLCHVLAWVEAPGLVRQAGFPPRVTLGERRGGRSDRVDRLCGAFRAAGIEAVASPDVETAVWEKFLFIDPFGSVGAACRSPAGAFRGVPETRAALLAAMREVASLARARGVRLADEAVDRVLGVIDSLPPEGMASMQRDLQAGRRSELMEQTGAVCRLGRAAGVPTPVHDVLLACLLPQELRARAGAPG